MEEAGFRRRASAFTLRELMKTILGLILIVAGIALFFQGLNRKDSVAGQLDRAGTSIANTVDGGTRTPKHVGFMVGGGALVIAGIALMATRGPRTTPNP
jgi:hypothetical protein